MSDKPVRTRIAPSPTGEYHIGHLATALRCYAHAKKHHGQFIVRIEDTDRTRYVEGAIERILQDMKDYGLNWDEGPDKPGDYGPYIQSRRLDLYQKYANQLLSENKAYHCFCSPERLAQMRQEQQKQKQLPKYDRHCLQLDPKEVQSRLEKREDYVIRLKIPNNQQIKFTDLIRGQISFNTQDIDDQVLLKSDGFPTYHLAVVVDDHLMNISHIIRGEDWISSTPKHIILYQAFGWSLPTYAHTPVFLDPSGKGKMSKRRGTVSARAFLDQGYLPQAMLNFLMIMGWAPKDKNEIMDLDRFIQEFDIQDISAKSVVFDTNKLNWLNGIYIRQLSDSDLLKKLQPFKPKQLPSDQLKFILPHIKERLVKLSDLPELTDFIYSYTIPQTKLLLKRSNPEEVKLQLTQTQKQLKALNQWNQESIETAIRTLQEKNDWQRGQFFMLLRLAITGKTVTPPLFESITAIDQSQVARRLQNCLDSLN